MMGAVSQKSQNSGHHLSVRMIISTFESSVDLVPKNL